MHDVTIMENSSSTHDEYIVQHGQATSSTLPPIQLTINTTILPSKKMKVSRLQRKDSVLNNFKTLTLYRALHRRTEEEEEKITGSFSQCVDKSLTNFDVVAQDMFHSDSSEQQGVQQKAVQQGEDPYDWLTLNTVYPEGIEYFPFQPADQTKFQTTIDLLPASKASKLKNNTYYVRNCFESYAKYIIWNLYRRQEIDMQNDETCYVY